MATRDTQSAINQFLEHLRVERNYSAHTLRNYRSDLETFFHCRRKSSRTPGTDSAPSDLAKAASFVLWRRPSDECLLARSDQHIQGPESRCYRR